MKSWIWSKSLSVIFVLFAVGHTLGTAVLRVRRGPQEAAVFAAMQGFRFPVMGFTRSYWDFYRGFALTISVLLTALAAFAWQTAAVSRRDPRLAMPMAVTLGLSSAGFAVLSAQFFFGGPVAFSLLAVACAAVVVVLLAREAAEACAGDPL